MPEPLPASDPKLRAQGLYDVCLSLSMKASVVPNDFDADGKMLVMITGANRGGKSTFLRSVGQASAHDAMRNVRSREGISGESVRWPVHHFKREEDSSMAAASSTRS